MSQITELNPDEFVWVAGPVEELATLNANTLQLVAEFVDNDEAIQLRNLLRFWSAPNVLQLLLNLSVRHALKLIAFLPIGPAARVLLESNDDVRALFLAEVGQKRIVALLNAMDDDDAARLCTSLPINLVADILPQLGAEHHIAQRLSYPPDSAGALMDSRFVTVPYDWMIGQVIVKLRQIPDFGNEVYSIYVVDDEDRLVGRLMVSRIPLLQKKTPVKDVMMDRSFWAPVDMDQEDVLSAADAYHLSSVPVVNDDMEVVGRITTEQLIDIQREEAWEDQKIMAGVSANARPTESVARIVQGRLPWLLAGMVGASTAAIVVGAFEDALATAAILASFIPIVMSMAGNAGIQASAVSVQGLASGALLAGQQWKRAGKELVGALLNGIFASVILTMLVFVFTFITEIDRPMTLAMTASLSLITVIAIAAVVGSSIPIFLDKIGVDPAMATGVFVTTSNDVLGVSVFFFMVTQLYL